MQAVKAAAARSFDVVVLDVEMPGLDGLAAGRAIVDLRPRTPPVLILKPVSRWMLRRRAGIP
ncbi:MAG: response regulator [Aquincola tertiaricarbonis]